MSVKSTIFAVKFISDAKDFKKGTDEAEGYLGKLGKSADKFVSNFGTAGLLAGAALTSGLSSAMDGQKAAAKFAASVGGSAKDAEKIGHIAGDLYSKNFGESVSELSETVGAVLSSVPNASKLSEQAIGDLTGKVDSLGQAFDLGPGEAAQSVGRLIKSGLAKDGTEAVDLLTASMSKLPADVRGEVLEATNEYSGFFNQLGLNGQQSLDLLTRAGQNGTIALDKMGDGLKEFTIRATDGSASSVKALQSIGLDATQVATDIASGGPAAAKAFQAVVGGLQGIKSPAVQAQTAIALFGTPLEDLGTSKVPDFLASLNNAGSGLADFQGAAGELSDTLNGGARNGIESFKRAFQGSLTEIATKALPLIQPGLDLLKQYAPIITPAIIAFVALVGAAKGVSLVTSTLGTFSGAAKLAVSGVQSGVTVAQNFAAGLTSAQAAASSFTGVAGTVGGVIRSATAATASGAAAFGQWAAASAVAGARAIAAGATFLALRVAQIAQTVATTVAAAAQAAFNFVMSLNPITLIIIAVVALVAALVWFFTQTELGKQIWANFTQFMSDAVKVAGDIVSGVFSFIGDAWNNTTKFLSDTWSNIWNFVVDFTKNSINVISGVVNGVSDGIKSVVNFVKDGVGWIVDQASKVGQWVGSFFGGGATGFSVNATAQQIFSPGSAEFGIGATGIPPLIGRFGGVPSLSAPAQTIITINMSSVIDPLGTAQAIRSTLNSHGVQIGAQKVSQIGVLNG